MGPVYAVSLFAIPVILIILIIYGGEDHEGEAIIMKKIRIATAFVLAGVLLVCAGCSDWDEEYDMPDEYAYCDEYSDYDECYPEGYGGYYSDYDECYDEGYCDGYGDYGGYGQYDEGSACYADDQNGSYGGYGDGDYYGSYNGYTEEFTLGSSGALEGRIAVVTILMDDAYTSWNLDDKNDNETYGYIYNDLEIACDWIKDSCSKYGRDVEFIWDWMEHQELYYELSIRGSAQTEGDYLYDELASVIRNNINSDDIKSKNNADGIIYLACLNTPGSNSTTSSTLMSERSSPVEEEVCMMMMHTEGQMEAPACFAHEILHTFGAADLYMPGMYGITDDLVRQLENSGSNDIMLTCTDPRSGYYVYDRITNDLTDITAYYTGLTDECDTVREWGLEKSDYE